MIRIVVILVILSGWFQIAVGQTFRGRVTDFLTKEPIAGATIKSKSLTTSNATGYFTLSDVRLGDTITIAHLGYQTYSFTFNSAHPGISSGSVPEFSLQAKSILLNEVAVKAARNRKLDSLKLREQFASTFNYRPARLKDVLITKDPNETFDCKKIHSGNNPYSASSVISMDVLQLLSVLNKKKTAPSRLQSTLLNEENNKYVDQLFSADQVAALTLLKGDSLKLFMINYRPSSLEASRMTAYEIVAYIKKKHAEFIR